MKVFDKCSRNLSLLLSVMILSLVSPLYSQNTLPNIVLIVADDLGYGDLSCYGAPDINTPNIDKLAEQGALLKTFYANGPECTPTRAALLTGRYQQRVGGLECAIGLGNIGRYDEALALSNQHKLGLPPADNVLPSVLKEKGYNTAITGKWHLGDGEEFQPTAQGFDYSIGPLGGAVDYFYHTEPEGEFIGTYMEGDHDLYRNGVEHHREGYYLTHLITDEAVEWIHIQKEENPFFLYIPYTTPHKPHQDPGVLLPSNLTMDDWNKTSRETYSSMIVEMDKGIGRILDKLEEKGFAENTLVIFFSDNGPNKIGSAGLYSGHKGQLLEGGIRVPCLIRWPGKIMPGTESSQIALSMDLTTSINHIVGGSSGKPLDGMDIIGHISSGKEDYPRTLFWRLKRADKVLKAVREGNMKYIANTKGDDTQEYLFDLSSDPQEKENLLTKRSEVLSDLKILLEEWENEVEP